MSLIERFAGKTVRKGKEQDRQQTAAPNLLLDAALADFRSSVHAWTAHRTAHAGSQEAINPPRPMSASLPHRRTRQWGPPRRPLGWALAGVLLAGGVSGGVWEHHRQQVKMAEARAAEQQRLAAQQQAQQAKDAQKDLRTHDLLAQVDSDVAQQVPTAMEPLAQLMVDGDTQ